MLPAVINAPLQQKLKRCEAEDGVTWWNPHQGFYSKPHDILQEIEGVQHEENSNEPPPFKSHVHALTIGEFWI